MNWRKRPIAGVDYKYSKVKDPPTVDVPLKSESGESKVLSVRVSSALYSEIQKLSVESGLDKSELLKMFISKGAAEIKKKFPRDTVVDLSKNADPKAIVYQDKGEVIAEQYMRDLLFSDVDMANGRLRILRGKWDSQ